MRPYSAEGSLFQIATLPRSLARTRKFFESEPDIGVKFTQNPPMLISNKDTCTFTYVIRTETMLKRKEYFLYLTQEHSIVIVVNLLP